jgi:hypothetical protein
MPFALGLLFTAFTMPMTLTVPLLPPSPQEVWMDALAQCESEGSTTIKVWDTNNQWSYGKYQWQMRSWLNYKKQGATKDNILDEEMQDKITRYVLDSGGWTNWWNCGKLISRTLGSYPRSLQ